MGALPAVRDLRPWQRCLTLTGLDGFRHDRLADEDRPPRLHPRGRRPHWSCSSLTAGTRPIADPERGAPSRSEWTDGGQEDAGQGNLPDATWAVFQELRPQFDGLLPLAVILDGVDHAVLDLLGSISEGHAPAHGALGTHLAKRSDLCVVTEFGVDLSRC
jgi:hypothetical protein